MYPIPSARPIAAVLAVVVREKHVLLVKRNNPPDAGMWGFPGGKTEIGETSFAAAQRELYEETGIVADPERILTVVDAIAKDDNGDVSTHYVMVAIQCRYVSGEPAAADDVSEARWVNIQHLLQDNYIMSEGVSELAILASGEQPDSCEQAPGRKQ